jgi:hypothetical protein
MTIQRAQRHDKTKTRTGNSRVRKSRRIALTAGVGVIVVLMALGGWLWYSIHYVPEFYRHALSKDHAQLEKSNKQMLRLTAALRNELRRAGVWQARFTADEINGWLAVDVPKNHPDLLPPQIEEPRVGISPDAVSVGARYTGSVTSVVSLEVSAHLPEENVVAVRIRKLRAGNVPWSIGRIIDEIVAAAGDLGIGVQQSQIDGDPLLLFSLSEYWEAQDRKVELVGLEFEDGAVVIRGRTK